MKFDIQEIWTSKVDKSCKFYFIDKNKYKKLMNNCHQNLEKYTDVLGKWYKQNPEWRLQPNKTHQTNDPGDNF